MGRFRDNAPVGHTCPKIDDVINSLGELYISQEPISKGELASIEKVMEQIRSDNAKLREWGNDQCQISNEMEKDRDYYQDLSQKYESEISDLKSEIQDLELTIKELEK